jgi:hypothetical protein
MTLIEGLERYRPDFTHHPPWGEPMCRAMSLIEITGLQLLCGFFAIRSTAQKVF